MGMSVPYVIVDFAHSSNSLSGSKLCLESFREHSHAQVRMHSVRHSAIR